MREITPKNWTIRWLAAPIVILLLLASCLVGVDRLAFRDVSHFYTPLYDYVGARCDDQWIPLWNPLDQTGVPLIGETSTAVLYPIRYVIYALPLSSTVAIAWYVAFHLIIASIAATFAARIAGARRLAACAAGIVYPLSGSVWFLYTNPPYLVSAAWLPLAMGALLSRRQRFSSAIVAGTAMAMMILGGDPQTALHTMIIAALIVTLNVCYRTLRRQSSYRQVAILIVSPLLAALLSLPQLAASISWSRQSDRTRPELETSRIAPPIVGGKRHEAYQFSLPPWHLAELITPNASGSLLPTNRRVSNILPGDGRMWTPTIYAGMIAAIVLIDRLLRVRREGVDPSLAMVMLSLALAGGQFGLGWWLQAGTGRFGNVDSGVGGPYWILYQFFPGYDAFRYPAKWLVFTSLGLSVLTAKWLDDRRTMIQRMRDFRISFLAVAAILVGGFAATTYARMRWESVIDLAKLRPDRFWGPLDVDGGLIQIQQSLLHSMVVVIVVAGSIWLASRRSWTHQRLVMVLMLTMLIDLAVAARSITYSVNVKEEQSLVASIAATPPVNVERWMRTRTGSGWPKIWSQTSSENRLIEVEASQRAAWFGRWHLADREAVLNGMVSIQSMAMTRIRDDLSAMKNRLQIDGVLTTSEAAIERNGLSLIDMSRLRNEMNRAKSNEIRIDEKTIVRPVFQDGNWYAEYQSRDRQDWTPVAVEPFESVMQSVRVPVGDEQVRYFYRPWWLWPTVAIALISWLTMAIRLFWKVGE